LAADLARRQAAVIFATGGNPPAFAAKAATAAIPIVFITGSDPVEVGLVASLNRPGSNVTGVSLFTSLLVAKRLELLRELVPTATILAFLVNPNNSNAQPDTRVAHAAAARFGQQLVVLSARTENDIDAAFAILLQRRASALVVNTDSFFLTRRNQIAAQAARHMVPTIHDLREYTVAGGLMSYGTNLRTPIAKEAPTSAGSSRVRSPTACRSCSPPSSTWSSISRPPRRSGSTCRPCCSPAPTR
jgi:putative tryptophan/tyrosine transport system substrate-binding protein